MKGVYEATIKIRVEEEEMDNNEAHNGEIVTKECIDEYVKEIILNAFDDEAKKTFEIINSRHEITK